MPGLAHIHRQPRLVAEVDVILDGLGRGITTVAVTGVHDVVIKFPVAEHVEVGVPAGSTQQNHVIGVHLADGLDCPLVERLEFLVQFLFVLKVMGYRLIHQLITENHRLVLVAGCDALPDVDEQLLARLTLKQPGVTMTIVDVVTRLSAWTVVHVENQIEASGTAPVHHRVDAGKAVLFLGATHVVLVGEKPVVEGQADGVGSLAGDEVDVGTSDVIVLELSPKISGKVRTHGLLDHQVDHPGRIGLAEAEHVALGIEPVAQICTLDIKFLSVRLHQVGTFHTDKLALGLCVKPQGKN